MSDLSDVSNACFGITLQQQGRGYYIALELLAMVRGTIEFGTEPLVRTSASPTIRRRSHDAARRLASRELGLLGEEQIEDLGGRDTAELLGRLFRSVIVTVPGRRAAAGLPWQQIYLTPYVGELVHWDAVQRQRRGGGAAIEEYSFRGVGAYAHWLLRQDPDDVRLAETRSALQQLVANAGTPLGALARAASARDEAPPQDGPRVDAPEGDAINDTPWVSWLRKGVHNIATRALPREKRVEMLMHWVPYVMARHILRVAEIRVGRDVSTPLVADFTGGPGPVRSLARRHYKDAVTTILDAMDTTAEEIGIAENLADSDRRRKWGPSRSFFTGTLAMIGALNAPVGSQHLTLGLPLLEALVAAAVKPGQQIEFSSLCQLLHEEMGVIVDPRAASSANLLQYANASDFDQNEAGLAQQLRSLGVLHDFSDSTRMVAISEPIAA